MIEYGAIPSLLALSLNLALPLHYSNLGNLPVVEGKVGLAPAEPGLGHAGRLLQHLVAHVPRLNPVGQLQIARRQVQPTSLGCTVVQLILVETDYSSSTY